MQFKKQITYSLLFSFATLITSIIIPIIPCRIAPGLPKPIYKWALCSLNPDKVVSINSIQEFFGYTTSLTESYFITIILAFTLAMVFFHFTTKKQGNK